ncbi:uncharacterized protein K452DRAFT_292032 [Aplosporella prunicola CBS 121167]|uniref:Heterokaryon incompatibility domain-containing protein n=1 Tax=Aplosporella prunicola CBS 121167 TaxID=1176127 RepID=A0A6A6B100_9PEZI|nr:uncharacterized protein K452DRAFT_292032 [Aplosporella prunicola CBS 121167]KAF2136894.1 hypothetical protein K452DRAFT_292032 [Aplosporella prunicola CBS 121167]
MNLDTKCTLAEIESRATDSLVHQILAIQDNYKLKEFKTNGRREWAERLECLCRKLPHEQGSRKRKWRQEDEDAEGAPLAGPLRTLGRRRRCPSESYVAVSYPWDASACESPESGRWQVWSERAGNFYPNQVRDVVLERATAYAKALGLDLIWIDRECIPQDERDGQEKSEKEYAIQCMDMVYRLYQYSYPVALLVVSINTEDDLVLLGRLLQNRFAWERKGKEYPILADEVAENPEKTLKILELLQRITFDPWWSRAWIFQEDYCAGTEMHLLLPHGRSVNKDMFDLFGNIPGELEVNSAKFRRAATLFCLAYKHAPAHAKENVGVAMCNDVLSKASQYNIVHKYTTAARDQRKWKAMTSTILADIGRRGITNASDLLAITANCCTYNARLDTKALKDAGASLSASILALYFLNGEIFCDGPENASASSQSVYDYLRTISLDFKLPVKSEELTFLKRCRLPTPELCASGVRTEGWLWRLDRTIDSSEIRTKKLSRKARKQTAEDGLSRDERFCLAQLAAHIPGIRDAVVTYFSEDWAAESPTDDLVWKGYMDDTARALVGAVDAGKTLLLGKLVSPTTTTTTTTTTTSDKDYDYDHDHDSCYRGVFVLDDDHDDHDDGGGEADTPTSTPAAQNKEPRYAFTAHMQGGHRASPGREYGLDKFVSLQVSLSTDTDTAAPTSTPTPTPTPTLTPTPRLHARRWLNGLVFPPQGEQSAQSVIFSWPAALRRNANANAATLPAK